MCSSNRHGGLRPAAGASRGQDSGTAPHAVAVAGAVPEFTPIPEQEARALEGRLTRPFWEHWKAQGWERFTELDMRPRDDTPRVIDLKLNGLPMTLTFALLRERETFFGPDEETVVRLTVECDGERIFSEDIVWNHASMDVTKQDWIDFTLHGTTHRA